MDSLYELLKKTANPLRTSQAGESTEARVKPTSWAPGGQGAGAALEDEHGAEYGIDVEEGRPAAKDTDELGPCSCCQGSRYWRNLSGSLICGKCHPPGSPAVVVEWIELAAQAPEPWGPEAQELIAWFEGAELPAEPFELWKWAKVSDPERFFSAVKREISFGPGGLRYRKGLLQDDLRRLRALFGMQGASE